MNRWNIEFRDSNTKGFCTRILAVMFIGIIIFVSIGARLIRLESRYESTDFDDVSAMGQNVHPADTPCHVSPLLEDILVVISYHWDVGKLVYLATMLDLIPTYETQVDVLIITDNSKPLHTILSNWGYFNSSHPMIRVWQAPTSKDENKYSLLWAHRQAIEEALEKHSDYTSFIYMEDDTHLTWPSVVSWALDTEILEPLNFTRCIYRTEVDVETGDFNLLDYSSPLNINSENMLDMSQNTDFLRVQRRVKAQSGCSCGKHRNGTPWTCGVHDRFVSPTEPFQGMWMASRTQLVHFMAHQFWNKDTSLHDHTIAKGFGYPERSTVMNLLVNVPEGLRSSCMVPFIISDEYDGVLKPILPVVGRVEHMRNGYSINAKTPLAKVHLQVALGGKVLLEKR